MNGTYTSSQTFTPMRPVKLAVSGDSTGTLEVAVQISTNPPKKSVITTLSANGNCEVDVSGDTLLLTVTGTVFFEVW